MAMIDLPVPEAPVKTLLSDEAIHRCMQLIAFKDMEQLVRPFNVLSINQWNTEQERLLLLTSHALYRIKYDFDSHSVHHFERMPLKDIKAIQHGPLIHGASQLVSPALSEAVSPYGLRIFTSFEAPGWFSKEQPYRTYTSLISPAANPGAHKGEILELLQQLQETRAGLEAKPFDVYEGVAIVRSAPWNVVSLVFNNAKMGVWHKS
eukprot:TRINITY_DN15321_c0_g1_i1.p1 TRINITY_DN15321_c0_g1~~TRINITY_DN15321_c0_g1_i1.p1  ORF type:complete len:242 (+),score=32.41 TRINITY_DN15321_c0_g1_i1:109-726(+)